MTTHKGGHEEVRRRPPVTGAAAGHLQGTCVRESHGQQSLGSAPAATRHTRAATTAASSSAAARRCRAPGIASSGAPASLPPGIAARLAPDKTDETLFRVSGPDLLPHSGSWQLPIESLYRTMGFFRATKRKVTSALLRT